MIQFDKLLKVAEHLEKGKLGHKVFDFSVINEKIHDNNLCGTNGCAIGELPIIFPDHWFFNRYNDYFPNLKKSSRYNIGKDVEYYFGITDEQTDHLFFPEEQETNKYGGIELNYSATKEQVASNIRAFVEKMQK